MPVQYRLLACPALLVLALCACQPASQPEASAESSDASIAHHPETAEANDAGHALPPRPVEPWPSDDALRKGMDGIATAVNEADSVAAAGTFDAATAAALAATVDEQVQYMFANCELPEDADAALHVMLTQLTEAAHALTPDNPTAGLDRMRAVLAHYPEYFEHLGWKPMEALI